MRTQTKEIQDNLTSGDALRILEEGNKRFIQNVKAQRNLKEQVLEIAKPLSKNGYGKYLVELVEND